MHFSQPPTSITNDPIHIVCLAPPIYADSWRKRPIYAEDLRRQPIYTDWQQDVCQLANGYRNVYKTNDRIDREHLVFALQTGNETLAKKGAKAISKGDYSHGIALKEAATFVKRGNKPFGTFYSSNALFALCWTYETAVSDH